ncbi:MAG TPA: LamG-like jellyroll fold domain-containing protein [Planctomycetota bacterium]|nr:LamG-like jellyroll fold domain-containing protein [Planctomycetota bacterium]
MRHLLCAAIAAAATLSAQDFIHYKFDANCTTEVINYATGPMALPANGTLQTNSAISPFDTGVFGGCLAGGANSAPTYFNRVITGWNPSTQNVTGDVTIAWYMRQRAGSAIGTGLNYLMGAYVGGYRLFTNGVAGVGLVQREILAGGGNNTVRDFQLPAATFNIQAAAAAGWVHVAMVVDSTAQTADWYINGTSVFQLTNVPGANIVLNGSFMIGAYSTSATAAGSVYDIDEFLMSLRAYSPTEMLALAQVLRAGDGDYNSDIPSQCGAGNIVLGSTGGRPTLGNAGYALTVTATTPSLFLLLAGFDRCLFGGAIPLPLDGTPLLPLLNGCWILADAPVLLNGVAVGTPATVSLAIPANPANLGTGVFSQCLGIDLGTFAGSMSNGFASSIGQ